MLLLLQNAMVALQREGGNLFHEQVFIFPMGLAKKMEGSSLHSKKGKKRPRKGLAAGEESNSSLLQYLREIGQSYWKKRGRGGGFAGRKENGMFYSDGDRPLNTKLGLRRNHGGGGGGLLSSLKVTPSRNAPFTLDKKG